MDKMIGVALVDEFDYWEEEILRKIQMEEQVKDLEMNSQFDNYSENSQQKTP